MSSTSTAPIGTQDPDTTTLFVRWQERGDTRARELLIERHLPLARSLASRYRRSSEPFEDLVQVASIGLVKAVDRFDADRGFAFTTFAIPTIYGELRRHFRDTGWAVHLPRGLQERAIQVDAAQQRLGGRIGRQPTANELAEYLELNVNEVTEALQAATAYAAVSLDAPAPGSSDGGATISFLEQHGREDERFELLEADLTIRQAARELPARERRILYLRFVKNLTQTQIAERVGVSQMQVSRLLRRTLEHLRELAEAGDTGAMCAGRAA
jgi:RNA polymerase sigma-B factor